MTSGNWTPQNDSRATERELGVRTGLTARCREVAQGVSTARYLDCHKEVKGKGTYAPVDARKAYTEVGREDRKVTVLMLQEQGWMSCSTDVTGTGLDVLQY